MNEKLQQAIEAAKRMHEKQSVMDTIVWENYSKDVPIIKSYGINFWKPNKLSVGQSFDNAWSGSSEMGTSCKVVAVFSVSLPDEFIQALNQIEALLKERRKNCARVTDLDTIFERILYRSNWSDDDSEWEIREVFLSLTGCETHGFLNDGDHKWIAVVSGRHIELTDSQKAILEQLEMGDNI